MMSINSIVPKKSFIITSVFIILLSFTSSYSYYEDFEASNGSYIPLPFNGWEWGVPTFGPNNAHSGTKVWATALGGNYANNANWNLTSPQFNATYTSPQLRFWHWYFFEGQATHYDGGNVQMSTDFGTTWTLIIPVGGYPGTIGSIPCYCGAMTTWNEAVFNLPVASDQHFLLRFHFFSDGSVCNYPGWYIDDITGIGFDVMPPPNNDVGTEAILSPGEYHLQCTPMTPLARIKNYGILNQTNVPVVCSIVGQNSLLRYTNTQTVNIGSGETLSVIFAPWIPTIEEVCTVKVRTNLPNDEVPENDRITRVTTISMSAHIYVGNATTNQRTEPLDRYYNSNIHEVIYLDSEIGISGSISQIGYYKHNGSNIDPITSVTIYMKQTTDDYMLSGSYSLTGYTQVYYGAFPNNATSGWMDVQLTTPFHYNNTSNLEILIIKGYQPYITIGYPYWRYTSTYPRYLTRGERHDGSQSGTLTLTYNRPNIRLLLSPVTIEESNNPNSMPMITTLYAPKPNPITNGRTQISFSLAEPSQVSLKIYDIQGRIVKILVNELMSLGIHNISWNCRDDYNRKVAEGIYFATLETPKQKFAKKLILTR